MSPPGNKNHPSMNASSLWVICSTASMRKFLAKFSSASGIDSPYPVHTVSRPRSISARHVATPAAIIFPGVCCLTLSIETTNLGVHSINMTSPYAEADQGGAREKAPAKRVVFPERVGDSRRTVFAVGPRGATDRVMGLGPQLACAETCHRRDEFRSSTAVQRIRSP